MIRIEILLLSYMTMYYTQVQKNIIGGKIQKYIRVIPEVYMTLYYT